MTGKYTAGMVRTLILMFAVTGALYAQTDAPENMENNGNNISEEAFPGGSVSIADPEIDPAAPAAQVSSGENLFTTVRQGGWVMIFIMGMLLLGMTLIVERFIFYIKTGAWKRETLNDILKNKTETSQSQYKEEMENDLRDEAQLYFNRLEKNLSLIHGIGNLAPLVGFFGTVIGMIKAFSSIASATVVNAKVVAVGIQVALVTTAGGLTVAVFTLTFYHLFANIVHNLYNHADDIIAGCIKELPPYSQKK